MTTRELTVPFAVDPLGRIAFVEDPYEQIVQRLKVLLSTRMSHRVMRPSYGSTVDDFVFAANDDQAIQRLTIEIEQAVQDWEPAVEVRGVVPQVDSAQGYLGLTVYFSLIGAGDNALTVHEAFIEVGGTVVSARG